MKITKYLRGRPFYSYKLYSIYKIKADDITYQVCGLYRFTPDIHGAKTLKQAMQLINNRGA